MTDPSTLSNEQLFAIAGIGGGSSTDLSGMSNEQLMQIAGVSAPKPNPLTAGETFAGGMQNLLNSMTFGFGDEITAGGSSLLDALTSNSSIGDAYDQRLAQARDLESRYRQEHPTASLANSLAGFLAPIPKILSAEKGIAPALGNVAKSAALGAGYAGASGFGNAEGGIENRISGAIDAAPTGAIIGGGVQGASEAIQGASSFLSKLASESAPKLARKSIGARASDYQKTANDLNLIELPEGDLGTLTRVSLDDLIKSGKLGESRDPSELIKVARQGEKSILQQIDSVVKGYDETKAAPVFPKFENATQFLESGKAPADKIDSYMNRLKNLETAIKEKGRGQLSYLQQQKIAQGALWDPHDSVLNKFNRAIYTDLQKSIEDVVPEIGPLNAELQKYKIVNPILSRSLVSDESKDGMSKLIALMRTSGGFGVPILASMYTLGAGPGALIGTSATLAGKYALSQPGLQQTANLLEQTIAPKAAAISRIASEKIPSALLPSVLAARHETAAKLPSAPIASPGLAPKLNRQSIQISSSSNSTAQPITKAITKLSKHLGRDLNGLEPLITAVIAQESGGNPEAKSSVGAQGLMQLMPGTGKQLAKELGETYRPKDAEQNIKLGSLYLTKLLPMFNYDLELALTAYHSGENKIKNLLRKTGGTTLADIRKHLGPQGRAYAQSVIEKLKGLA